MTPSHTKKLFVPLEFYPHFASRDFQALNLDLLLTPLQPPDGICGFLPVYETVEELRKTHPSAAYIRLMGPVSAVMPTLVYGDRATFPKQARGFSIAYGSIEALRRQVPQAEFFSLDGPWPLPETWPVDKPDAKQFSAGDTPGSAQNSSEMPAAPLDGLKHLGPDWRN